MKVIKTDNLPAKLPIMSTLIVWMMLEHWKAPQWVWGAVGLLFVLIWGIAIAKVCKQEETDIFSKDKDKP